MCCWIVYATAACWPTKPEEVGVLAWEQAWEHAPRTQRDVLVPRSPSYRNQGRWDKSTHRVSPPCQHGCGCHNPQPAFGNLSCCKNLVDSGCWKITRSKCPRSSSGGQGQAHTEDRPRVLEPASANTCHTAGAVCGKAIPSWRRIYKYKILTNNRNVNSRLSGKEPNITLPNKPPVFFLKVNFMRVIRSTAMRMLSGIRLLI